MRTSTLPMALKPTIAKPAALPSPIALLPPTATMQVAGSIRPVPPAIQCESAILVDAISGQVLYAKNADERRPMASTTKIMTALVLCENAGETDIVCASEYAASIKDSSLHLKKGEKLTVKDLLRAVLMRSANDGCVAAAEHVAGNEVAFVEKMNARAAELGATHTHFTNPHGLHNPEHYTTARDLATIARAAMQNARICDVVKRLKTKIARSTNSRDVTMNNHSVKFLKHFPGADGIKTGWTVPAGHCFVGSTTWGGWRLISVVLKSKNYVQDTSALMKFGYQNFTVHKLAKSGAIVGECMVNGGNEPKVFAMTQFPVQIVLPKASESRVESQMELPLVNAPLAYGAPIGSMKIFIDGVPVLSSPLLSNAAVEATPGFANSVRQGNPWKTAALVATIFGAGLVSLRYGKRYRTRIAKIAKNARIGGRRLAKSFRNSNHDR